MATMRNRSHLATVNYKVMRFSKFCNK